MTKTNIINKMKKLNLPKGSYVVFGSGPLALLDIREVNDIDLLVSQELYEQLLKKGWKKINKGPKDEPVTYQDFEAHNSWEFSTYSPTLKELLARSLEYDGISFASLDDVEKWKKASGRPKDLIDLKRISNYKNLHK